MVAFVFNLAVSLSAIAIGVVAVPQQPDALCQACTSEVFFILQGCTANPNCSYCDAAWIIAGCETTVCSASDVALIYDSINTRFKQAGVSLTADQIKNTCASNARPGVGGQPPPGGGSGSSISIDPSVSASCQTCLAPFAQQLSTIPDCAGNQACVCGVVNGFKSCQTDATKCTASDSSLVDGSADAALKSTGFTAAQLKDTCVEPGLGGTGGPRPGVGGLGAGPIGGAGGAGLGGAGAGAGGAGLGGAGAGAGGAGLGGAGAGAGSGSPGLGPLGTAAGPGHSEATRTVSTLGTGLVAVALAFFFA